MTAAVRSVDYSRFKVSLADDVRLGFAAQDCSTQTEETEVQKLKEITTAMYKLVKDSREMRRDLNLTKESIKAEYEEKLSEKTRELYRRCNDQVNDLERDYEERVGVVRRSFRQQLSDALCSVNSQNTELLQTMAPKPKKSSAKKENNKLVELKLLNEELQNKNEELLENLEDAYKEIRFLKEIVQAAEEEPKISQEDLDKVNDELDRQREANADLERKISMEQANNEALKHTITELQIKIAKKEEEKAEVLKEFEEFKISSKKEMEKFAIETDRKLKEFEDQKIKEMKEMSNTIKEKILKEVEAERQKDKEEIERLVQERKGVEAKLNSELIRQSKEYESKLILARRTERQLSEAADRANREIVNMEKRWNKKFEVIKQSFQAIREETHLRNSLKKTALKLGHAEVLYRQNNPLQYLPPPYEKVPDISSATASRHTRVTFKENSLTISEPSEKSFKDYEVNQFIVEPEYEYLFGVISSG